MKTIDCPHWKDIGLPRVGECVLGAVGGRPPHVVCRIVCELGRRPPGVVIPSGGPGTELKRLLATLGIVAGPSCTCNAMAAKMDAGGVEWCDEHMDEIVTVMETEANKRGWWKYAPFKLAGARWAIHKAITVSKTQPT